MIELGSAGMMRQGRVLAALARENSPAHAKAARAAGGKLGVKIASAIAREVPRSETQIVGQATRRRIGAFLARLGLTNR